MASVKYLWHFRAKFPVTSIAFYRAWGKRFFLLVGLLSRNYRRYTLIRKGATICDTAEIGEVSIDGSRKFLSVGGFSFLGKAYISLHTNVKIGNYVCINDGVEILTASHDVLDPEWKHIKGEVIIEDYAWIGTGAMILPGVHIARGAVIGARAVVSKSVSEGCIVVGNPAKLTNKTRHIDFNYNPCEFLAANRAWLIG
ncbi:hypothetical protein GCM10028808_45780 [Spirosoma migulaei]